MGGVFEREGLCSYRLPVWTSKFSVHIANPGWQAEAKRQLCMYLWVCVFPLGLLSLLHSLCLSPCLLVPPSPVSCFTSEWGADVSWDMCVSYLPSSSVWFGCNYRDKPPFFLYRLCVGAGIKMRNKGIAYTCLSFIDLPLTQTQHLPLC